MSRAFKYGNQCLSEGAEWSFRLAVGRRSDHFAFEVVVQTAASDSEASVDPVAVVFEYFHAAFYVFQLPHLVFTSKDNIADLFLYFLLVLLL